MYSSVEGKVSDEGVDFRIVSFLAAVYTMKMRLNFRLRKKVIETNSYFVNSRFVV